MTGAELIAWRQDLGLSQVKAAAILGLTDRTMSRYEHDRWPIPALVGYACEWLRLFPPDDRTEALLGRVAGELAAIDPDWAENYIDAATGE